MKKLNQRGITTIEVIISFVLVILISASLFATITAYNTKRLNENYETSVLNELYARGLDLSGYDAEYRAGIGNAIAADVVEKYFTKSPFTGL